MRCPGHRSRAVSAQRCAGDGVCGAVTTCRRGEARCRARGGVTTWDSGWWTRSERGGRPASRMTGAPGSRSRCSPSPCEHRPVLPGAPSKEEPRPDDERGSTSGFPPLWTDLLMKWGRRGAPLWTRRGRRWGQPAYDDRRTMPDLRRRHPPPVDTKLWTSSSSQRPESGASRAQGCADDIRATHRVHLWSDSARGRPPGTTAARPRAAARCRTRELPSSR